MPHPTDLIIPVSVSDADACGMFRRRLSEIRESRRVTCWGTIIPCARINTITCSWCGRQVVEGSDRGHVFNCPWAIKYMEKKY